jgi:hypothetical protein
MKIVLAIIAAGFLVALYTAWLNGFFRRCPHCRKIGAWRYDPAEPAVVDKDEDGIVQSSRQLRICRKCGNRIMDRWSDHGGRTFEKAGG